MGGIRDYNVPSGVQTDTPFGSTDPVDAGDFINKGYADSAYTPQTAVKPQVVSAADMRAIASAGLTQGTRTFLTTNNSEWYYSTSSSASDDGINVIKPTDVSGNGRWLNLSTGGGGGGGTGNDISLLLHKVELEKYGIVTFPTKNSIINSFMSSRFEAEARLLEDYPGSGTGMKITCNNIYVDPADKSMDSAADWSAINAATNLGTTSTGKKVGTAMVKFDKNNSNVAAGITITTPTPYSVKDNKFLFFWAVLPSITNLASIRVSVSQDSGFTNYVDFDLTLDAFGNALAVGANLMKLDVNGTPTNTTGTGWTIDDQIGGLGLSVVTTSSAQTYTAVGFDAARFADSTGAYFQLGDVLTIYDSSNRSVMQIDASSTDVNGLIVLSSALGHSYAADDGATSSKIVRVVPTLAQGRATPKVGLSGAIANLQEVRQKRHLHNNLTAANLTAFTSFETAKIFRVKQIVSSTIKFDDPADWHAEFVTGNTIRVLRPFFGDGQESYEPQSVNPALTGNATATGGVTTLPLASVAGIQVGDIIFKDQVVANASLVGSLANENLQSMSFDHLEVGDIGIRVSPETMYTHWALGGYGTSGRSNLFGKGPNLGVFGAPSVLNPFAPRRFSASGFSSTDFFQLTSAETAQFPFDTAGDEVSMSFWMMYPSLPGASQAIFTDSDNSANGVGLFYSQPTSQLSMQFQNAGSPLFASHPAVLLPGVWYNIVLVFNGTGNASQIYVNGAEFSFVQPPSNMSGGQFYIGGDHVGSAQFSGLLADWVIWKSLLSQTQAAQIANSGIPRQLFPYASLKMFHMIAGMNGQKLTDERVISRTTDADDIFLYDQGIVSV